MLPNFGKNTLSMSFFKNIYSAYWPSRSPEKCYNEDKSNCVHPLFSKKQSLKFLKHIMYIGHSTRC